MADKLPPWAKKLTLWILAMTCVSATFAAGGYLWPKIQWAMTYELSKRVDQNALNIYSKFSLVETRLTSIETMISKRDEKRDKELLNLAFDVWEKKQNASARVP